jgi:hypothetical protein
MTPFKDSIRSSWSNAKKMVADIKPGDDFECLSSSLIKSDPDAMIAGMTVQKNGKLFDIRRNAKRIWIQCDDAIVKYGYAPDQYKVDSKDGTFVLHTNDVIASVVETVDKVVLSEFESMFTGKILNNIVMTKNAIRTMFRPSLYAETLRLTVSPLNCAAFRSDGSNMVNPNFPDILKPDTSLSVIIEPAFAWMYNRKIGIHWDARQIKLSKVSFRTIFPGFKPPRTKESAEQLKVEDKENGGEQNVKRYTLLFDESDDEEKNDTKCK